MKKTILIAAIMAAVLPAAPGMAQPTAAPPAKDAQMQQQAPEVAEFDKQMAQMQQTMQRMQEQMEMIRQTQDPQERQKLLQEHWETMRNGMGTMHGMWGPGIRGSTLHPDFRPFSESASSAGAGLTAAIAKALWWHVCNRKTQA